MQAVSLFQSYLNERSYSSQGEATIKDHHYIIAACHLLTLAFVGCFGNCSSLGTDGENPIIVFCSIL